MQREHNVATRGLVTKNVLWLSRRNLEAVRVHLSSDPWRALRMLDNEDDVMAAMQAAVTEWNNENCLMKRARQRVAQEHLKGVKKLQSWGRFNETGGIGGAKSSAVAVAAAMAAAQKRLKRLESAAMMGGLWTKALSTIWGPSGSGSESGSPGSASPSPSPATHTPYRSGSGLRLDKLWQEDIGCRKGVVQFKFVDGEFSDVPYIEQLQMVFKTGVLVGVHGAGLTHGFALPPGTSAVLQVRPPGEGKGGGGGRQQWVRGWCGSNAVGRGLVRMGDAEALPSMMAQSRRQRRCGICRSSIRSGTVAQPSCQGVGAGAPLGAPGIAMPSAHPAARSPGLPGLPSSACLSNTAHIRTSPMRPRHPPTPPPHTRPAGAGRGVRARAPSQRLPQHGDQRGQLVQRRGVRRVQRQHGRAGGGAQAGHGLCGPPGAAANGVWRGRGGGRWHVRPLQGRCVLRLRR